MSCTARRAAARKAPMPIRCASAATTPSAVLPLPMTRAVIPSAQAAAADEERLRIPGVAAPMRRGELVFDEPVGGEIVRHPQKQFGEHHQRETLLRRQGIFAQKIFDPADADRFRPHRGDETQGAPVDPRLGLARPAPHRREDRRRAPRLPGRRGPKKPDATKSEVMRGIFCKRCQT